MIVRALALLAAAAALTGCTDRALDPAGEFADAVKDRTPGPAQRCVNLSRIEGPRIIGQTILYRDGARLYATTAVDGCPSLSGDPVIVVETYGSQLCANDRFRTLPRGTTIPGPYCRFGPFTPYSRAQR